MVEYILKGSGAMTAEKVKTKPKYNMWQNTAFMIKTAWKAKEKKVLVLCVLTAIFGVIDGVINLYVTPVILAKIENRVPITELILTILIFVSALILTAAVSRYIYANSLFGKVTVRSEIIAMLNKKAATTSYPNVENDKFRKLLSKANMAVSSNSEATEAVWQTLQELLKNVLGFALYGALLTSIQPLLLLIILATTVVGYFVNNYLSGYGYRHRDEESEYTKKIGYLKERPNDYSAAKDIRIFGLRGWISELYEKNMRLYVAFHKKAEGVYLWANVTDLVLSFLRNGIAYFYLISLVLEGNIDVSLFLLYFTAVGGFTSWVSGILGNLNTLYKQSLDISTVRETLDFPEVFKFEDGESLAPDNNTPYEITLENVSLRYDGAEKDTLTDINLTLHAGEKLAVVGLNGAGKTTLVKLICGFLEPTKGRVLLNGEDIRKFNRRDYYKLFSAVFQNFSILAATVAENVAQTDKDIDTSLVNLCIEKAGLTDKISSLPKGLDTHLNRGVYDDAVMLSGGETQRLMLARALYRNAPIIILDEPTAALDPLAEADMYQKYNSMTENKSSVYISHRLASTRFCDRIILIDNAKIAEMGTHAELMNKGGKYAEIYAVQSKYYSDEGAEDNEE